VFSLALIAVITGLESMEKGSEIDEVEGGLAIF
jgi:hypothetical protein